MSLRRTVEKASSKVLHSVQIPCWKRGRQPVILLTAPQHLGFHTSRCLNSALFNLGGLSTSRESQFLAKEYGRPRTDFAPHLELIRSSEVDTQKAPGFIISPASITNKQKVVNGSSVTFSPDGSATMSQKSYHDLQYSITTLQGKLNESEHESRKLLEKYEKASEDASLTRVLCTIFALAILFNHEIRDFHVAALQAWQRYRGEEERFVEGENPSQSSLQLPELMWKADVDSDPGNPDTEAAHPNDPWTFSRLFWAAKD